MRLEVLSFSAKELRMACQVVHGQVEGTCEDKCEDFSIWFLDEMCSLKNGEWSISVEIYPLITNKKKKISKNHCKVLRYIATVPQQQAGFGS